MCRESLCVIVVFFFKQKTAYEMRISDWSSDVCSSDLTHLGDEQAGLAAEAAADGLHAPFGLAPSRIARIGAAIDAAHRLRHGIVAAEHILQRGGDFAQGAARPRGLDGEGRSEEPTSALQSLMRIPYAAFCFKT